MGHGGAAELFERAEWEWNQLLRAELLNLFSRVILVINGKCRMTNVRLHTLGGVHTALLFASPR